MFFQNSDVSMRTRLCVIPAFVMLALVSMSPKVVMAQDAATPVAEALVGDDGKLKPITDQYVAMSFENLSKMYWAVALPNIESDEDVDNYLLINECELYQKFYHNDFEWQEIRRVTRNFLQANLTSFPQQFEVVMPIYLDRYDVGVEKFIIQRDSQFINVRRLDVKPNNSSEEVCGKRSVIGKYARNLVLNFNIPFTLKDVPVGAEIAEFYLEESMRQYENLPPKWRIQSYERVAFVRLKVTMLQFKGFERIENGAERASIFARVDGYDIFADQEKRLLMFSQSFSKGGAKKRRVSTDGVTSEDGPIQVPLEGKALLSPTVSE